MRDASHSILAIKNLSFCSRLLIMVFMLFKLVKNDQFTYFIQMKIFLCEINFDLKSSMYIFIEYLFLDLS